MSVGPETEPVCREQSFPVWVGDQIAELGVNPSDLTLNFRLSFGTNLEPDQVLRLLQTSLAEQGVEGAEFHCYDDQESTRKLRLVRLNNFFIKTPAGDMLYSQETRQVSLLFEPERPHIAVVHNVLVNFMGGLNQQLADDLQTALRPHYLGLQA